jgi:glycosyltransferase involved in cell wall biosynthesis
MKMNPSNSIENSIISNPSTNPTPIAISFIINNYNYDRFLTDAITSALNQAHLDQSFEVIVVDDGSTDNSREILTYFNPHIHPVLKSNGGQASAFNAGFAASVGEWICFLDADDCVRPDKAARILQIAQQYPQAEWIFHSLQPVDEQLNPLIATCDKEGVTLLNLRSGMANGRLKKKYLPFPIPATSGLCIRRSLLKEILPMPEAEGIALNDTYLQFAALGNRPGIFLNEPLAAQRYHGKNSFINQPNPALNARIMLLTAYWLRQNFSHLAAFSNTILSQSILSQWRSGQSLEPSDRSLMTNYLSSLSWLDRVCIYLETIYHFLRNS